MLYEKVNFQSLEALFIKSISIIDYPLHKHDNAFELVYVLEGKIELYLVNTYETLVAGDIQICNPNELHSLKGLSEDNVVLFLYINLDYCSDIFRDLKTYIFTTRNIKKDSASLYKLRDGVRNIADHFYEDKYKKSDFDTPIKDLLNIMIEHFQFYYILDDNKLHASDVFKKNEIQIDRIRRANNYIYENYNKQIKLEDLSEIENITPQHMTHILKSGGGLGFRKLLNMSRVEKSSHLLLGSDKSLQSISFECGFSKYQYYKEAFVKFYRMNPSDYRKKYKDATIANKIAEYTVPDRDQIIGLLKGMGNVTRDINFEFQKINKEKSFNKYTSAKLDLRNYNHLTSFDLVKHAAFDTSLNNICFDGSFIAEHKSSWGNFSRILIDLIDLHFNIIIEVDAKEKVQSFKAIINFLTECAYKNSKMINIAIFYTDNQEEASLRLFQIATDNHISASLIRRQSIHLDLPTEKPGFIPAYMLDILNRNYNECFNPITLIDNIQVDKKSHSEKFGLIDQSGLRLPPYYLYYMLKRMGKYLVYNENDFFATTNETKSDIQFLFYNYIEECVENDFSDNTGDMTDALEHNIDYKVNLNGLNGFYAIKKYRFKGEDFNSRYNPGFNLSKLSEDSMSIFNESLEPVKRVNFVKTNNNYAFSFSLMPFEIMLISFEQV